MIHYEQFVKLFPGLRLSRSQIMRADEKVIANYHLFLREFNDRLTRWAELYAASGMPEWVKEDLLDAERRSRYWKEMYENVHTMSRYVREGERVFTLKHDLARMLVDTDMPRTLSEDFHLPFPTIYIEFPEGMFKMGVKPYTFQALGCYVMDMRPELPGICVQVVHDINRDHSYALGFGLGLTIHCRNSEEINWTDMEQELLASVESIRDSKDEQGEAYLAAITEQSNEMLRCIVNTILYSTCANADIVEEVAAWRGDLEQIRKLPKNSRQRKKRQERLDASVRTRRSTLGKSIVIKYGAPEAHDQSEEAREYRKLLERQRVRGHWWPKVPRPLGERFKQRRWVEPYWRGPANLAEALKKKYQLK